MIPFDEQLPGSVEDQDPLAALVSKLRQQQPPPAEDFVLSENYEPDYIRQQRATISAQRDSAQEKFLDLFTRSAIEPPDEYVKKRIQDDLFGGQEPTRKGRASLFLKNILGAVAAGDKFKPLQQRVRENALQEYKLRQANRSSEISEQKAIMTSMIAQLKNEEAARLGQENANIKLYLGNKEAEIKKERYANELKTKLIDLAIKEGKLDLDTLQHNLEVAKFDRDNDDPVMKTESGNLYMTRKRHYRDTLGKSDAEAALLAYRDVTGEKAKSEVKERVSWTPITVQTVREGKPVVEQHPAGIPTISRYGPAGSVFQSPYQGMRQGPGSVPGTLVQPQGQETPQAQPTLGPQGQQVPQNLQAQASQISAAAPRRGGSAAVGVPSNQLAGIPTDPRYQGSRVYKIYGDGYKTPEAEKNQKARFDLIVLANDLGEQAIDAFEKKQLPGTNFLKRAGIAVLGDEKTLKSAQAIDAANAYGLGTLYQTVEKGRKSEVYSESGMQVNQTELESVKGRWPGLHMSPELFLRSALYSTLMMKTADWKAQLFYSGVPREAILRTTTKTEAEHLVDSLVRDYRSGKKNSAQLMEALDPERLFNPRLQANILKERGGAPAKPIVTGEQKSQKEAGKDSIHLYLYPK